VGIKGISLSQKPSKPYCRVLLGYCPDSMDTLDGKQSGFWHQAVVNTVPLSSFTNASRLGVFTFLFPSRLSSEALYWSTWIRITFGLFFTLSIIIFSPLPSSCFVLLYLKYIQQYDPGHGLSVLQTMTGKNVPTGIISLNYQ
jgi:hypothetical protein